MGAVEGLLQRAMEGHGVVVTVVGSPGIGKSRLVREVSALAKARGVETQQGDVDGAIEVARAALDNLIASGDGVYRGLATTTLVDALLRRGADGDIAEAHAAINRLAAVPTDPGYVMHELPLLRMRAHYWHTPRETTPPTATIGIGIERWPPTWASRAI
jgi:hypothetical protein